MPDKSAENEFYDALNQPLGVSDKTAKDLREKGRVAIREAYSQGCDDTQRNLKRNILAVFGK